MRLGALLTSRTVAFALCCCLAEAFLLQLVAARRFAHLAEREDISRGIASGSRFVRLLDGLDRAASTVSREIARHGGRPAYRAHDADRQAWVSALRPKSCLLAVNRKLRNIVASKLILDWSPEQISGWLKIQYPDDESMRVSHETIYRSLFIQARGVLKKELMDHLRSKRRMRRSRHSANTDSHAGRSSMPSPSAKDQRKWKTERFLAIGKAICWRWKEQLHCDAGGAPFTLCHADQSAEQRNGSCGCCLESACSQAPCYAETLADVGSRTGDGEAQGLYGGYDVQVYFCDPQSPWQRGKTKTPICSCGNTSREEPTCLAFLKRSSTRSRCA